MFPKQLLDFGNNEITFMHWQHQESPVNMIDWCSQLVRQVTKVNMLYCLFR